MNQPQSERKNDVHLYLVNLSIAYSRILQYIIEHGIDYFGVANSGSIIYNKQLGHD